jgi:tRNA(Ile)-lysidine synthase TilS/MesJ
LPFVSERGTLGPGASEAAARDARYGFLQRAAAAATARAIVTAHHQDDLIETMVINLMRGTGRRGLTSLGDTEALRRPLLGTAKVSILDYARAHSLEWREDKTNADQKYLRNYIRLTLAPRLAAADRAALLAAHDRLTAVNRDIDTAVANLLHSQSSTAVLDRRQFTALPHPVAKEVMAGWLRARGLGSFTSRDLERLVVAAKVYRAGTKADAGRGAVLQIGKDSVALILPVA